MVVWVVERSKRKNGGKKVPRKSKKMDVSHRKTMPFAAGKKHKLDRDHFSLLSFDKILYIHTLPFAFCFLEIS